MGKVSIKTIGIGEYLALLKDRKIPLYKNPYSWNKEKTETLIKDIASSIEKDSYTLGQIIYNKDNLVDGLDRIITLSLILKALDKGSIDINKEWTPKEIRQLKENYGVCRKSLAFVDKEGFLSFLLDKCTIVLIDVDDIFDSFCFFEAGNDRGKELEPTDLLKAYHLCSMRDKSEGEKLLAISRWEEIGKEELVSLFSLWFPIIKWTKGEACPLFSKSAISSFEGIEENCSYPFARRIISSSFSIDSTIINGKDFFDRCFYYYGKMKEAERIIDACLPSLKKNISKDIPSENICFYLFRILSLYTLDRFGSDVLSKCIMTLFKFSFALLFEDSSISIEKINEYVLSKTSIFKAIEYSLSPYDIYSYDLKANLSDIRNVVYKGDGAVRAIDFDNDYDRWLK